MAVTAGRAGPLRLVLVTETFPPEVNGVARTLGRWVGTFEQRGHRVHVVRPRREREPFAADRVLGLPLPFYPELRFGVADPLRLYDFLRRCRPDLVHTATEGPLGLAALLAARQLRLPVASSFHTNFDDYLGHYGLGLFAGLAGAYLRWFHNQTAATLVPSESTRQRLASLGFERVEIWSRGVDAGHFHPRHRDAALRRSLELEPDDVLLLYVGRLAAEKNLPALLDAYGRLRGRLGPAAKRVRLALVGGGPLADHVRGLRLPGVVLPGYQVGEPLTRWYASADVFAFPSLSETFGNVIVEAMASGLPVVGLDCPGVRERITDGHDGLLVPADGDMAEALERLVRNRDERQRLGTAARGTAERLDWEPIFDALERRYRELVDASTAASPLSPLGGRGVGGKGAGLLTAATSSPS